MASFKDYLVYLKYVDNLVMTAAAVGSYLETSDEVAFADELTSIALETAREAVGHDDLVKKLDEDALRAWVVEGVRVFMPLFER